MSKAYFYINTGNNRMAKLIMDCSYNGGQWEQVSLPGNNQMVFPVRTGYWKRETENNGRGGSQFEYIVLYHQSNKVASILFQEFNISKTYTGKMVPRDEYPTTKGAIFWADFTLLPFICPQKKTFQIRATGGASVGYGVAGYDCLSFEIKDAQGNISSYTYEGKGLSLGVGPKKLPKTLPGGAGAGPWNSFTSHGWRKVNEFEGNASTGGINLNSGTAISTATWLKFSDVTISPFEGGAGYSLPSAGGTTGTFKISAKVNSVATR